MGVEIVWNEFYGSGSGGVSSGGAKGGGAPREALFAEDVPDVM